jgi:hypothetical protein
MAAATSPAFAQSAAGSEAVTTLLESDTREDERIALDETDLSSDESAAKGVTPDAATAFATSPLAAAPYVFTLGEYGRPLGAMALPKVPLAVSTTTGERSATATATNADDDGSGLRIAGYVAGGVGLAGMALFAIAGLSAKSAYDKLESDCGNAPCTDEAHRSDIEGGRMMQTAANIGLATGFVGLGVGATLLVLGNRSSTDKPAPSASVSANGGMLTYGGRF